MLSAATGNVFDSSRARRRGGRVVLVPALLALALGNWAAEGETVTSVEKPVERAPAPVLSPIGDLSLIDDDRWVSAVSRRRQRIENAPQPVTVLSSRDLITTPAVTLADRLRYVAGVDVYQDRHGQFDIGLRGYNGILNNRIQVLLDGREFRQEEFGSVLWRGILTSSDIQRVEIIKGPSSVGYGANAFGGVIAIEGREPGDKQQVFAVGDIGNPHAADADATALGPLGRYSYYKLNVGTTRLKDFNGVQSGLPRSDSNQTGATYDDDLLSRRYGGLVGVRLPGANRLEIDYHAADVPRWEFIDDLDVGSNHAAFYDDDFGARLKGPWGQIGYLHHRSDKTYQTQKVVYLPAEAFRYTQGGFITTEDRLRGQVNHDWERNHLSLGAEVSRWESRSNLWSTTGRFGDRDTWAKVVTTNRALFAEDQFQAVDTVQFTAGARVDNHSRTGLHASPRAAINWKPDDDQFVLLSYSSGYRLPSPIESYLSEYYFKSDANLSVETINALELAWQMRPTTGSNVALGTFFNRSNQQVWLLPLDAATMRTNYQSWLASGPDLTRPPGPFFAYTNLDNPATVLGAEASARSALGETPFTLWGNTTAQYYRYEHGIRYQSGGFDDAFGRRIFAFDQTLPKDVNGPPPVKVNLGLTYERGLYFGGLAGRWVASRKQFSFGNSFFNDGGPIVVQTVPAYACLDFTVGLTFGGSTSDYRFIRLSVLDVFDSNHYETIRADPAALRVASSLEDQTSSAIGRQIVLQGGWSF